MEKTIIRTGLPIPPKGNSKSEKTQIETQHDSLNTVVDAVVKKRFEQPVKKITAKRTEEVQPFKGGPGRVVQGFKVDTVSIDDLSEAPTGMRPRSWDPVFRSLDKPGKGSYASFQVPASYMKKMRTTVAKKNRAMPHKTFVLLPEERCREYRFSCPRGGGRVVRIK